MMKQYPRPYMTIVDDLYRTLRKLQGLLSGSDAPSRVKQIDATIVRLLRLRAELTHSLHDALLAEIIYAVVYHYAVPPSYQAFILGLRANSYSSGLRDIIDQFAEVNGSGQSRPSIITVS